MQRRVFLEWTIRSLGAVLAVAVGVPAVAFLVDGRNRTSRQTSFRTVARLSELETGKPREVFLRENRRDAWSARPDSIIGRVWLVRRADRQVDAFNATCPHLGCSINSAANGFLCPCHGARFETNGVRAAPLAANPSPRDMDRLNVQLQSIPGQNDDFEVQVEFKRFNSGLAESIEAG